MLPRDLRTLAADAAAKAAGSAFANAEAIIATDQRIQSPHTSGDATVEVEEEGGKESGALRVGQADLDAALAALKQRTATEVSSMRLRVQSLEVSVRMISLWNVQGRTFQTSSEVVARNPDC